MNMTPEMKTNLLEKLWLPIMIKGGKTLYPRRHYKKMKLLTLTYSKNFQEIEMLEERNLTEKEHITAWALTYLVQVRLETELGSATITGASRYEDSIPHRNFKIRDRFPFDIINLDFTSQNPYSELGRVEKELASLERTTKLQADHDNDGFVLIYTTLLNSKDMHFSQIIDTSRSISAAQPLRINNTAFSSTIQDQSEKIGCLEQLYEKICLKYYSKIDYDKIIRPLNGDVFSLCSFAGILRRSDG